MSGLVYTETPEPIEVSEDRIYIDRGMTLITFGLMDGANQERQKEPLSLPDSLRVALLLKDGSVIEARAGETLHAQLIDERCRIGVDTQGWTLDKADWPGGKA